MMTRSAQASEPHPPTPSHINKRPSDTQETRPVKSAMPKIQTGLGLDRDTYRSFYTEIEGILAKNGWDQLRFRSSVQKSAIFDALIPLVTTNGILHERFPDTVRRVETKAGRMALEGMVYKICCNVRRRKRQPG